MIERGHDLTLGVRNRPDSRQALRSLIGFLGAADEAYRGRRMGGRPSENKSLFGPEVMEFAYVNAEELALAGEQLEVGLER